MDPWKVSAQFAAFVWYENRRSQDRATQKKAAQFARDNWIAFLPYAHEGYGKLLIKIAQRGPARLADSGGKSFKGGRAIVAQRPAKAG